MTWQDNEGAATKELCCDHHMGEYLDIGRSARGTAFTAAPPLANAGRSGVSVSAVAPEESRAPLREMETG